MTGVAVWSLPLPIETDRLRLREHRVDDLDDLVAFHGDPDVTRFIPWPVRDRAATEAALAEKLPRASAAAVGEWLVYAIEERASGAVIGEVLLKRVAVDAAEIGYVVRRDRWGAGLAGEAVGALLDVAVPALGIRRVSAVVEQGNDASVRLLVRLGLQFVGEEHDASVRLLHFARHID